MAAASTTGTAAPSTATKETHGPVATGALLAFTAGFVDTCGFIALFGLFTAHVTGNFVLIGAAIADPHHGLIGKLLALPVFVGVVAATHLFVLHRQRRSRAAATPVLVGQIVFLALFLAAGVTASPFASADAPVAIAAGMLGVAAMAIQNAASRTAFASLSPTTVMTGNVTQIVIDLVDLIGNRAAAEGTRARLGKMGAAVAAFAVGALGAGFGYVAAGFWCLAVPILAVVVVLVRQARAR